MLLDVAHNMLNLIPSDLRFTTSAWSPRRSWPGCPAFYFAIWRTSIDRRKEIKRTKFLIYKEKKNVFNLLTRC